MSELIISDTSCLIVLDNSGQLDLLRQLFATVVVTPEVAKEYARPLPSWIRQQAPQDTARQRLLSGLLDAGEASAISLAIEQQPCILLIDEKKGRRVAVEMGLKIIGTVRVLILAKSNGLIPSLRSALGALTAAGFRLSPQFVAETLKVYGD